MAKNKKIKGIVIAAGSGVRLRPLTDPVPKTMLPIFGKTIIEHILYAFNTNDVSEHAIITGYKQETLQQFQASFFYNKDYLVNNILHSLMKSRTFLEKCLSEKADVIISYSDVYYTPNVVSQLKNANGEIVVVIDKDWTKLYKNRDDNPIEQAERAQYSIEGVVNLGKGISPNSNLKEGEFIGLLKLSPVGIVQWLKVFDEINSKISLLTPFHRAPEWQKSYLTDFLQELCDQKIPVSFCEISNDWIEFDTLGDYKRVSECRTYSEFYDKYIK